MSVTFIDRPTEAELVERLIAAERDNRHLRQALREVSDLAGETEAPGASYVVALLARIGVLEENLRRLTSRKRSA